MLLMSGGNSAERRAQARLCYPRKAHPVGSLFAEAAAGSRVFARKSSPPRTSTNRMSFAASKKTSGAFARQQSPPGLPRPQRHSDSFSEDQPLRSQPRSRILGARDKHA